MKTILKISTVLSWFNLVIWGIFTLFSLLAGVMLGNLTMLIFAFLLSAIILHSYAALQLRKSIRNTAIPLSTHTPTGIRFIGAIALFFGVAFFANGVAILQNPHDSLKLLQPQLPPGKTLELYHIRVMGFFGLLCGLSIALNVMLNFRLLRWYHFMKGMM